jgi:hypothetical protein
MACDVDGAARMSAALDSAAADSLSHASRAPSPLCAMHHRHQVDPSRTRNKLKMKQDYKNALDPPLEAVARMSHGECPGSGQCCLATKADLSSHVRKVVGFAAGFLGASPLATRAVGRTSALSSGDRHGFAEPATRPRHMVPAARLRRCWPRQRDAPCGWHDITGPAPHNATLGTRGIAAHLQAAVVAGGANAPPVARGSTCAAPGRRRERPRASADGAGAIAMYHHARPCPSSALGFMPAHSSWLRRGDVTWDLQPAPQHLPPNACDRAAGEHRPPDGQADPRLRETADASRWRGLRVATLRNCAQQMTGNGGSP